MRAPPSRTVYATNQVYKISVEYIPGPSNIADYLSRNPERKQQQIFATVAAEEYVNQFAKATEPFQISADELVKDTVKNPELREVIRALGQASWKKRLQGNTGKI